MTSSRARATSRAPDAERLRAETVLGVAQHDNGWWKWDATAQFADVDGFPWELADAEELHDDHG